MSRGITETDVWKACDALLLSGARPTIERVRLHLGRGSPNTVGPHLDAWFRHLGARIKDPGSFAMPADLPDAVQGAAKHFWEMALAETRRDFDRRLAESMAAAVANVESEKERAALSEAAAFEAVARAGRLQTELAERQITLEHERLAQAKLEAHLADAGRQISELRARLASSEDQAADLRSARQQEWQELNERMTAVERRCAKDVEAERQARALAEKRLDACQTKFERAQASARQAAVTQAEAAAILKAEVKRLTRELARSHAAEQKSAAEIRRLQSQVSNEQRLTERAKAESALARQWLTTPEAKVPAAKTRRRRAATATAAADTGAVPPAASKP